MSGFVVVLAAITTHVIAAGYGVWLGRRIGLRDGWHIGRLAGLREARTVEVWPRDEQ